jgi:hypothetical protein
VAIHFPKVLIRPPVLSCASAVEEIWEYKAKLLAFRLLNRHSVSGIIRKLSVKSSAMFARVVPNRMLLAKAA